MMKYSLPYFDESAHLAADDSWHDAPFWFFHASLLRSQLWFYSSKD